MPPLKIKNSGGFLAPIREDEEVKLTDIIQAELNLPVVPLTKTQRQRAKKRERKLELQKLAKDANSNRSDSGSSGDEAGVGVGEVKIEPEVFEAPELRQTDELTSAVTNVNLLELQERLKEAEHSDSDSEDRSQDEDEVEVAETEVVGGDIVIPPTVVKRAPIEDYLQNECTPFALDLGLKPHSLEVKLNKGVVTSTSCSVNGGVVSAFVTSPPSNRPRVLYLQGEVESRVLTTKRNRKKATVCREPIGSLSEAVDFRKMILSSFAGTKLQELRRHEVTSNLPMGLQLVPAFKDKQGSELLHTKVLIAPDGGLDYEFEKNQSCPTRTHLTGVSFLKCLFFFFVDETVEYIFSQTEDLFKN
jgi:hypothetical protein